MQRIALQEALSILRTELSRSILAAANEDLHFEVGTIDMTLQLEIQRDIEVSGNLKFWIVEIGGKTVETDKTVHTLKFALTPRREDGRPVLTSGATAPGHLPPRSGSQ